MKASVRRTPGAGVPWLRSSFIGDLSSAGRLGNRVYQAPLLRKVAPGTEMLPGLPSLDSPQPRGNMDLPKGGRMYPKFTAPKTLTKAEQRRLLRAVRAHGSPRDRALLSLALSTGLRLRELAGLNVGDVSVRKAGNAWKVVLDPEPSQRQRAGVVDVA